jgi:hypothetical protein
MLTQAEREFQVLLDEELAITCGACFEGIHAACAGWRDSVDSQPRPSCLCRLMGHRGWLA